jgi:hypothetical protein
MRVVIDEGIVSKLVKEGRTKKMGGEKIKVKTS